jgi:hypothetical protein
VLRQWSRRATCRAGMPGCGTGGEEARMADESHGTRGEHAGVRHSWSRLTHLQVGRYAEYFVKMEFVLFGFDVYSSEVDDRGIDFVLRKRPATYYDVQVKSVRRSKYIFFPKSQFELRPNLFAALVLFQENETPELFLIPSHAWQRPNDLLVSRDYLELKSKPEYGVMLSRKTRDLLDGYKFESIITKL